ncbi:MAG: hypothetical protein JO045_25955 [Mycobacterium sp.]|nr:hypothetical protein [Mycobacterium sp.]
MTDIESLRARQDAIVRRVKARGAEVLGDIEDEQFRSLQDRIGEIERREQLHAGAAPSTASTAATAASAVRALI